MGNLLANKEKVLELLVLHFFMKYPLMANLERGCKAQYKNVQRKETELAALKITETLLCITSNLNYNNDTIMCNYTHQILCKF